MTLQSDWHAARLVRNINHRSNIIFLGDFNLLQTGTKKINSKMVAQTDVAGKSNFIMVSWPANRE